MRILLARCIVNVEVSEPLRHVDDCVVIGHQVFMSEFVLPANLIDDEIRITVRFEIFNPNLIGDLHPDQESVVFRYIVGTRLS